MKYYLSIFMTFFFMTSAFAEDQVHCAPEKSEQEIFLLLETVKNEILGTVPRFCRSKDYEQLSEQVNPGEHSLSDFVDQLKTLKAENKDAFTIEKKDYHDILFQNIKLISLKKAWALSSEDDQYESLLSDECIDMSLNKLPLKPRSGKKSSIKSNDAKTIKAICQAVDMESLAPFMTKDILAESLLNLKILFPESFPKFTEQLCSDISSIDEAILKNEEYGNFLIGDQTLMSAKEFSSWLKETYKEVSLTMEELTPRAQFKKSLIEMKEAFKSQQVMLEDAYKKGTEEEQKNNSVTAEDNPGFIITKLPSGSYKMILGPKGQENEKKNLEMMTKMAKDHAQAALGQTQTYLKKIYEDAQEVKPQELVPDSINKGFFVKKDEQGKYIYVLDEAMKKKVQASLLEYQKIEKKMAKIDSPSYMKDEDIQKNLKELYEVQEKSGGGLQGFYSSVEKGEDGFYKFSETQFFDGWSKTPNATDIYFQEMTKNSDNKIIPGMNSGGMNYVPMGMGAVAEGSTVLMPKKDGKVQSLFVYNDLEKVLAAKEKNPPPQYAEYGYRIDVSSIVSMTISNKYQNTKEAENKKNQIAPADLLALGEYTGSGFVSINSCLRKENCNDEQKNQISGINTALSKLKEKDHKQNDEKLLFRGAFIPKKIADELKESPKEYVLDKGFMSTSGNALTAKGFSNSGSYDTNGLSEKMLSIKTEEDFKKFQEELEKASLEKDSEFFKKKSKDGESSLFIIKAKSCSGIASLSRVQGEDEFLCPPGMKFNVTKQKDGVYVLEEVSGNK